MKYDVSMHIPNQMEGLLMSFQKADIQGLERCLENIKNLIKDNKFQSDISDYEKKRLDQITVLQKKALDSAKTIMNAKSFGELYVDMEEIKNDLVVAVDGVEKKFWNLIKEYTTKYLNQEPREIDAEEDLETLEKD